jgi:4-amino-4-deoxy-L-arabinose transferase-like glycosyltransferase
VWAYILSSASRYFYSLNQAQRVVTADEEEIIDEQARPAKRSIYLLAAIILVSAVTFFFGLGDLALTGPDEPRYAEVAREMYVRGDYISPHLAGCLWFEKPVLVYWMAAASYGLFGVSEFAARFPSAVCALLTVLIIYFGLRRSVSTVWAASASLAIATGGLFLGFSRAVTMDMALTFAIAAALMSGYLSTESTGKARAACWALCWAAAGLACLAKGFIGILLVGAVLGSYLIVSGRWRDFGWREAAVAITAMTAVAGTWYIPVIARHGHAFIDEFIIEHHFQRYVTTVHSHPQPVYFFLFVVLAGMMPWTFLMIPAATRIRTLCPRASKSDSLLTFAWIWLAVPTLFFSFSSSKLPGYILPVFPALAIIVGAEIERIWQGERSHAISAGLFLTALFLVAIGVAFIVYTGQQGVASDGWQALMKWGPLAVSFIALAVLALSRARHFLVAAGSLVLITVTAIVITLFPKLSYTLSHKALSLEAAAALRPGEKIGFYRMKEFAPIFYGEGRVVCGVGEGSVLNALTTDSLVTALERESSLIVFTEKIWLEQLESDGRLSMAQVGEQRKAIALRVGLKTINH